MDEVRRQLRSFSDAAATEGKFLDWFERLYEHADSNQHGFHGRKVNRIHCLWIG